MKRVVACVAAMVVLSACNPAYPSVDRSISEPVNAQIEALASEVVISSTVTTIPSEVPKATATTAPTPTRLLPPTVTSTHTPTLAPTDTADPNTIGWDEAAQHIGEEMTVCGPVIGAHYAQSSQGQPTFLNIGNDYPSPERFTAVIWGEDRSNFSAQPEDYYLGRYVCVSGLIEAYEGIAEVKVEDPGQITTK